MRSRNCICITMAVLTSLVACLALALSANPAASQMLLLEDHAADNTPEQAKPTKTHHGSSGQHGHHGSHTSGSGKHHAQEGDSQQSQHSGKHKPNFFPRGPIFVSPSLSEDGGRVEAEARIMGGEVVTTTYVRCGEPLSECASQNAPTKCASNASEYALQS